jgi:dipeptidyl aminopeptidase/acylaminoacyl peptidase
MPAEPIQFNRMPRLLSLLFLAVALFAQKAPFDFSAMMKLKRISEPAVSPDGKLVAFTVQTVDLEKNTRPRQIWIVPLNGGEPKPLTNEGANSRALWSPDSKKIAFLSTRGGVSQIWTMDPDGSNSKQISSLSTEADGHLWSPDGKSFVFTSEVYPDCGADDACNKKKLDEDAKNKVKAKTYTSLLYRHWTQWQGARRKHILVMPAEGGAAKDLTPGSRDIPPFSLGGPDDYAISPDSKELCYGANLDPDQAYSTNAELYTVPLEGGEPKKISTSPGADNGPQYSPDGKWIAWRMQVRAGYESDRWRLVAMARDTGKISVLTESLDRMVTGFTWFPDSTKIAMTVEDRGRQNVQMIPVAGGGARVITPGAAHIDDAVFTADGKTLVYTEQSGSSPVEIYRAVSNEKTPTPLTHLNDAVLNEYQLTPLEDFSVKGAEDASVHTYLVKPPNFDPAKKYPALILIHGGPQGAWGETFSYRWNQQVFAAAGFVVAMPNPRGSTGYGQKFTDDINGDWGGRVYDDVMAVTEYVAKLPYVDGDRMAAAGGSYGGYMANWLQGHTDRFKALVTHAGVYDLRSKAGETEELWFPKWELKGMPWENPEMYERWSPSNFVKDFKTPMLVIHGELDYRVVTGQALQLFTALQTQKVPSKLLLYPDEGHWILKPQNSELWYKTFLEWITEWTRKK